jgi:cobalt/nickel transport system permease protein
VSCTTYFAGDTVIHRLDPRGRIVMSAAFSLLMALSSDFTVLGLGAGLAALAVILARIPAAPLAKRLMRLNAFMAVVFILVPVTYPGRPAFTVWILSYSWEGLAWCAVLVLKANAIVLAFTALLGTVELFELGRAFEHLRVPDKLIHLFMFTLRYLDVLHHEYENLLRSMKARAFRPRMSRHTYAAYGNLVAMLLVRSLERSERILAAMKCRGFRGRFHIMRHFEFGRCDLVFVSIGTLIIVTLGVIEFAGG